MQLGEMHLVQNNLSTLKLVTKVDIRHDEIADLKSKIEAAHAERGELQNKIKEYPEQD